MTDSAWGSGWLPGGGCDLDDSEPWVVWNSSRDSGGVWKVGPNGGLIAKALLWAVREFRLS